MKEIWKNIPNQPNYQCSNYGRIKSLSRWVYHPRSINGRIKTKTRIIKTPVVAGYCLVTIRRKIYPIHRLVATLFIKNKGNKPQVNHKDGIKTNNFYKNLEWVTRSENVKHSYVIGTSVKKTGTKSNPRISVTIAKEIREMYAGGKYSYSHFTQVYGICKSSVSNIVNNRICI